MKALVSVVNLTNVKDDPNSFMIIDRVVENYWQKPYETHKSLRANSITNYPLCFSVSLSLSLSIYMVYITYTNNNLTKN